MRFSRSRGRIAILLRDIVNALGQRNPSCLPAKDPHHYRVFNRKGTDSRGQRLDFAAFPVIVRQFAE